MLKRNFLWSRRTSLLTKVQTLCFMCSSPSLYFPFLLPLSLSFRDYGFLHSQRSNIHKYLSIKYFCNGVLPLPPRRVGTCVCVSDLCVDRHRSVYESSYSSGNWMSDSLDRSFSFSSGNKPPCGVWQNRTTVICKGLWEDYL